MLDTLITSSNSFLYEFLKLRSEGYEGCSLHNLSMYYFNSLWGYYCANYEDATCDNKIAYDFCTIRGGMSNLIDALCRQLEGNIFYNMPLTSISRSGQGKYILKLGDKEILADRVILALPFSTLRDVKIEENILPNDQLQMIQELQYGTNAKILVPTVGESKQCCGANKHCMMLKEESVLCLYFGGDSGVFDENALQEKYSDQISSIKRLYPEITFDEYIDVLPYTNKSSVMVNHPIGISWINEEYSKGSYSCLAPGQEKIYNRFTFYNKVKVRNIFRPISDSIFFIGEHTSIHNPSTMEGAVESGEQVVRMILTSE